MHAAPFSAVQAFMQQHPELSAVSPQWQSLAGGSSNQLYRSEATVRGTPAAVVLRVNATPEQVPGVDRAREAEVLAQLQGQPWAPWVLHCALSADEQTDDKEGHGWLLTHWHGDSLTDPLTAAQRAQLRTAVAAWQALELDAQTVPANSLHMDYTALLAGYAAQLVGLPMERALQQMVERASRELARLPGVPAVLTHHDLHPGNLCVHQDTLVVLDWEYAALGNAWFDAAALVQRCGMKAEDIAVLPAFVGLEDTALAEGLMRARWLGDALECLWYWARGLSGTDRKMADLMRETLRLLKQPEETAAD